MVGLRLVVNTVNIIDSALPDEQFKVLQNAILSWDFPWYYGGTAYMGKLENQLFGNSFTHNALFNGKYLSDIAPLLEQSIITLVDSIGQKLDKILRVRLALTTVTEKSYQHPPHIDMTMPHQVGILYLNDADGDTYFYDKKYNLDDGGDTYAQYMKIKDNLILTDRVTPKANRFVNFDGLYYHNSSTPTTVQRRVILNFNYTTVV